MKAITRVKEDVRRVEERLKKEEEGGSLRIDFALIIS